MLQYSKGQPATTDTWQYQISFSVTAETFLSSENGKLWKSTSYKKIDFVQILHKISHKINALILEEAKQA